MNYIGEHLLPGQLGHFFVVLSLVASLVACIAYSKSANAGLAEVAEGWKRLARAAFIVDCISVFAVFGILYYIISSHLFEYFYAWNHSSKSLSSDYLLSCIWEGQEGSFLLWTVWHCILGIILMFRAKQWEAPVMAVISFAQFCLATMIIGVYVFGLKIGSNPFLLVRDQFQDAPIFQRPDYLSLASMQDGQGLNQLLQNYWMVIHPPVLFLGFASTIIPFAYAIAGLWKKEYGGWVKAALPWTLFSACILGTGIIMGAAWAYESLTFGGYWAWDPVENASLVPWLILIAGLHTLIVYKSTGHSLRTTYLFFILTFIFILYSTYLTRSGDLQETSVHAFTGAGMNWQLRIFLLVFALPAFVLFIKRYKQIPAVAKEENTYSREFWMFVGALVLFLSGLFIIISTSLPVINKLFHTNFALGEDVEFTYNQIQIFVAIIIGIIAAITQPYLKFKNTPKQTLLKKMAAPTILSLLISVSISLWGNINYTKYGIGYLTAIHLAIFSSVYAVVSNFGYIWTGLRTKLKSAGGPLSHAGFGLMLLGILISSSKKEVVSLNTTGINLRFDPKSKERPQENLTLIKGIPTDMGKYMATYVNSDSTDRNGTVTFFKINLTKKDSSESFNLYPNLIRNTKGQEGFSNNPDKRHYWNKDIFSYISYADNMDTKADTAQFKKYEAAVNDTLFYSNGLMVVNKVVVNPNEGKYSFTSLDTALMADITVISKEGNQYHARPVYYIKNDQAQYIIDTVFAQNLAIGFSRILDNKKLELQVKESSKMLPFVALKVYAFPYINILWVGAIIMIVGFVLSMIKRFKQSNS